ncbi:LamG-like jellyroll fold domain-containing protein [Mesorhizobium sp.]|uniref:LamG-like jellyroll fold domain-containing protein n=1 Tax=Mesorhizobium sp. TaxID=1871066 RepID=UPI0025C0C949|nr:LamG-like jellyroll fold domain-containing protein [Mesorhizobium sp.]
MLTQLVGFGAIEQTAGGGALAIFGTPVTATQEDVPYAGFTVSATGGTAPYIFSVHTGTLPTGITLNSSTGVVSGTPTTIGTSTGIVIRVTDNVGATADLAPFNLQVYGDPHFANVVLLLGFDGADGATSISDESLSGHALTVFGNAQLDTGVAPPFGTSSLLLDGTGDYLTTPDSDDFNFGTGDFTIELFTRTAAASNNNYMLVHAGSSGNISYSWRCNASNQQDVFWSINGSTTFNLIGASGGVPLTTWRHLCFERSGTKLRLYADGVMETSSTTIGANALFDSSAVLAIGMRSTSTTNGFNGNIKELRITKGVARYNDDAGFTVPTAAFPRG